MKGLFEIECNEDLWTQCTCNLQNGWGNLENEIRFAYQTSNKRIDVDDIEAKLCEKFPTVDQIEVHRVYPSDREPGMCYFGATLIIYDSDICDKL